MEEDKVDKFLWQKLNSYGLPPSSEVWERIDSQLEKEKKWAGFKYSNTAILMIIFLLVGGSSYLLYQVYSLDNKVQSLTKELSKQKQQINGTENKRNATEIEYEIKRDLHEKNLSLNEKSKSLSRIENDSTLNLSENKANKILDELNAEKTKILPSTSSKNGADATVMIDNKANTHTNNRNTKHAETQMGSILNKQWDFENNVEAKDTSESANRKTSAEAALIRTENLREMDYFITQRINSIGASNIFISNKASMVHFTHRDTDYYRLPRAKFLLGAYGITSYNYRRVNSNDATGEELVTFLNNSEKTEINYGGGLSINYNLNKNWRIGFAFEYRKKEQRAKYPIFIEGENVEYEITEANGQMNWSYDESFNSSLGYANFQINHTGGPYNGLELGVSSNEYETEIIALRSQEVLRIPILVEYGIFKGNWRFLLGGGLAYDRVLSDRSKLSITDFKNADFSEPETTLGNYFSYHLGLAAEYSLTERISIRLSPRYESWLTPVFQNEELSTLPYSISLAAGLGISF